MCVDSLTRAVEAVQTTYFTQLNNLYTTYTTPPLMQQAAKTNTPLSVSQLQDLFGGAYHVFA